MLYSDTVKLEKIGNDMVVTTNEAIELTELLFKKLEDIKKKNIWIGDASTKYYELISPDKDVLNSFYEILKKQGNYLISCSEILEKLIKKFRR